METNKPLVCVIGAGPTGLVCLKYLREIADLKCYELKSEIGGLWVYKDTTDDDHKEDDKFYELYGTVHESIYKDLTTIIPIHFFAFKDFPPKKKERTHFTHEEVLEYLQDYSANFDLERFIEFETQVIEVTKTTDGPKDWTVKVKNNGETKEEHFDYVIVCNGHNSVPYFPTEGIEGLDLFKGKILHAHNFRKPDTEDFIDKNVLLVGLKYSGMDILYQLLESNNIRAIINGEEPNYTIDESGIGAKKIILSASTAHDLSQSDDFKKYADKGIIVPKSGSKLEFTEDGVIYEDGSEEKIDTILFSTGYKFSFPFIKDPSLVEYECDGRYFGPLYQRIFSINHPSLIFVGQPDSNAFNQILMERQVMFMKSFIEGNLTLPSKEEMMEHLEKDKKHVEENYGLRNFYKAPFQYTSGYIKELKEILKSQDIEPNEDNKEHLKTLFKMLPIFKETLTSHNCITFQRYDYKSLIPEDHKFDSSEYF
ncbi:unnamed protein product [Moneuplotes crassus]|uniref:Flavin-containing monooxygenase n=1 Tax=Euplotes crassus TaxID=5936 RepID=A0AAD1UF64_EUPCR|nr:unnamed protein product [Moneuplotes crassus]